MTEPKEALKPCPFCGGEATAMDMETYRTTPSWSAFCNQEPCRFEGGFGGYSTEAKAIAAWNTRADASENAALREKLAEREALIKATESAAFEKAAKVLDQAGMEWAGLREGVYFDRLAKEIRALTGGDNAEG